MLFVAWLSRQLTNQELQPDVLAALSDTEALPVSTIRDRPPLDSRDVDFDRLSRILDELCGAGLVVRWYVSGETTAGQTQARLPVYRKLRTIAATGR
jgi:hypothetical protein